MAPTVFDKPTTTTGMVAALLRDDSQAETAIDRLKNAGFTGTDIGMATVGGRDTGQHVGFWNKVVNAFGKQERPEPGQELAGTLSSSGLSPEQARYFDESLSGDRVLVTIHTGSPERAMMARRIMQSVGADLGESTSNIPARAANKGVEGERRIQLLGEILRVHKERVQRGEVRLRKEVVTETQHVEVPVTREELVVERTQAQNREAAGPVGSGEKEIRVPLSEERVTVEKTPVVNEEVRVRKQEVHDVKRIDDTVRHEELRTDKGNVRDDITDEGEKAA